MVNFGAVFIATTVLILVPSAIGARSAKTSDALTAESVKALRELFKGSKKCMDDVKVVVQKASTNVDIALQIMRRLDRQRIELLEAEKLLGSSGSIGKEAAFKAMYFVKNYFMSLDQQLEYGLGLINKSAVQSVFLECQEQVDIDVGKIRKRDYFVY